jgi:hypothetical protein
MKEKILELRAANKTYDEICEILNCSKSTVAWHCSEDVRTVSKKNRNINRNKARYDLKMEYGGKCKKCGYDKCLSALDFHHMDSTTKENSVSTLLDSRGIATARKEAEKCILLCGNCHSELHEGLIIL